MIKTSKYFRDYVRQSGRENIDCYVMIGGTKVNRGDIESLKVNYSLGNNNIPSIGNAVSQTLTMTLYRRNNVPNYLYLDRTVIPYIGFNVFNGKRWSYEYIKLGTFYVPNSDNVTKNDFKISLTCFDNMARMSDETRKRVQINYNKPEVPTGTVRSICEWLSRKAGIQFDYNSIDEDIPVNVSPAGWNVREVLQELAFIQGKNVIVNRDNVFTFIRPTKVPFKEFNIKPKNIVKLDWAADLNSNIAALQVEQLNYTRYDDEVDVPAHTYEVIEGSGVEYDPDDYDNLDVLQDNQITGVGFRTSIITSVDDLARVYDRCMPYSYYKFNMTTQGFPQVEIGDIITVTTQSGDERDLLIASHELIYDGGCKSNFITSGRDAEYLDVCDIQWWDLVTKTDATESEEIKKDVNELQEKSIDVESGITTLNSDDTDFWAMYLKTYNEVNKKIDGIYAPPLIHIEKIKNGLRFKLAYLKYDRDSKDWLIDRVDTFEHVCDGGGGGDPTITYTLTIKYVYEDGTEAAPTYIANVSSGKTYSVESPTIDGYTPSIENVSGTITQNTEVIVTYKVAAPDFNGKLLECEPTIYASVSDDEANEEQFARGIGVLAYTVEDLNSENVTKAFFSHASVMNATNDYYKFIYEDQANKVGKLGAQFTFKLSFFAYEGSAASKNKYFSVIHNDPTMTNMDAANYYKELVYVENIRDDLDDYSKKVGEFYSITNTNRTDDYCGRLQTINSGTSGNIIDVSRVFIGLSSDHLDGYNTITYYVLDGNYTFKIWRHINISKKISSIVDNINTTYDIQTRSFVDTEVSCNYNVDPLTYGINDPNIISTFMTVGFANQYDKDGIPLLSSLVYSYHKDGDGVILGFGRITGYNGTSDISNNVEYQILKGLRINAKFGNTSDEVDQYPS